MSSHSATECNILTGTVISISPSPNLSFTSPIARRLVQPDTGLRMSADPSLLVHALLDLSMLFSKGQIYCN